MHCKRWEYLERGDILVLRKDEAVPADVVVLASGAADGMVYIQTSSLDGEKGLKTKHQAEEVLDMRLDRVQVAVEEAN